MRGQGTHTEGGRSVNEDWYVAGEAAMARVETMPQPEKSGVSSHVFWEQWKNTEIYSSILLKGLFISLHLCM